MLRPVSGTDELVVEESEVREDEGVNDRVAVAEDEEEVESLFVSLSVKL